MKLASFCVFLVSCTPPVAIKDATVAAKDIVCLISTFSSDVSSGMTDAQASLDSANKCNVLSDVATTILAAHTAGAQKEAVAAARKAP